MHAFGKKGYQINICKHIKASDQAALHLFVYRWFRTKQKPQSPSSMQPTTASVQLRERLLVTLLAVIFYYYPSLLLNTWSLFACYQVDRPNGVSYPDNCRVSGLIALGCRNLLRDCFCSDASRHSRNNQLLDASNSSVPTGSSVVWAK